MSFQNTAHIDWQNPENRKAMKKALSDVATSPRKTYGPCAGDKPLPHAPESLFSRDPADADHILCSIYESGEAGVKAAERCAQNAFINGTLGSPGERASLLRNTAQLIHVGRFHIAALIVYEVSKSWDEALAEVEEGIDFLTLYADAIESMLAETPYQSSLEAESNTGDYRPRGITAAISSWNFPFALSVEKIAASLAAGCPVIYKPAEQSPCVGHEVVRYFYEAGASPDSIVYLPGTAHTGKALVRAPLVTQITFTGSREAGIAIHQSAAETPSIAGPKRVDLEMGGNNSMILCPSAIQDEALSDWVTSKMGYAGQKCSALQRGIIIGDKNSRQVNMFRERLCDALESIEIGHPEHARFAYGGALIDADAYAHVYDTIERLGPRYSCGIEHAFSVPENGWFIPPHVLDDAPKEAAATEVFGPVLFLFYANSLAEAVAIANDTEYGLTAGIHTEMSSEIDYFRKHVNAGNVYINRTITGSIVGRQPFGGYKYSGFGEKVGLPERVLFFSNIRIVTENHMRHGTVA